MTWREYILLDMPRMAALDWSSGYLFNAFGVRREYWQYGELYTSRMSHAFDRYGERAAIAQFFEHAAYAPPQFRLLEAPKQATQLSLWEDAA